MNRHDRFYFLLFTILCALMACLVGCSASSKADSLYESGSYKEALAAYQALAPSAEVDKKISECQKMILVDFLRSNGSFTKKETVTEFGAEKETKVTASEDGAIALTYTEDTATADETFKIVIPKDSKVADVNASLTVSTGGAAGKETASGTLDIGTYRYGNKITWDDTSNDASTIYGANVSNMTVFVLDENANTVENMVKALNSAIEASNHNGNSGCTLKSIGFDLL